MIYPLKRYHQHNQFRLHSNSTNFSMSWNNCDYILIKYTSAWLYHDLPHFLTICCSLILMNELNAALFLSTQSISSTLSSTPVLRFIASFTTIYASLYSHKSDLSISVLNLLFLLTKCPINESFT